LFAFLLTVPGLVTVLGPGSFLPDQTRQGWVNTVVGILYKLPGAALGCLAAIALISFAVGVCSRLARRRAAFRHPSAPVPHGKYLPWGRNLRRHASIPARYGGLRPRKPLRPLRRRADWP